MAFEPDIVVTGPEPSEIALVVEVKTSSRSIDESERQLKKYMAAVGSPVGLLVTPDLLWIYRDQYLPSPEHSIIRVGEFEAKGLFRFERSNFERSNKVTADTLSFERQVQSWLETLSTESGLRELAPDLRRAVQMYLVPALLQGAVRCGHPRSPTSV